MFEMKRTLALATVGAAALGAAAFAPVAGAEMKHEGVTVNILTRPGPVIAGRLEERGEEFKEMTGATIEVATVPFADLFQKLLTDWSTGTNSIDVGVFASGWAVELADSGLLADLSDFVANDPDIQFDDIAPYFREFNQKIDGKTYLITVDGDFHMLYYRTDVLEKNGLEPPDTWDEYLEVAAAVHGQDMNGDGEPDYGSCLFKKRNAQSFWLILSFAGAFLQSQGTGQGIFFDTETMEPLVRNEGFAEALRLLKATGQYGPPDELNLDVTDTRPIVLSGRCALLLEWGDIGPLSIDLTQSKIKGLVASKILPGSTRVVDRATGKLVDCTPELCPHAIDGVNHTPFAAFGGWSGAVNAKADPKVIAGRVRLPVLHERAGAVQLRRDARLDGLRPVPDLAVRERPAMGRPGLHEGRGGELPRGHRAESQQPEHGLRPPHPRHPAVRGHLSRPRDRPVPRRRDHGRGDDGQHLRVLGRGHRGLRPRAPGRAVSRVPRHHQLA